MLLQRDVDFNVMDNDSMTPLIATTQGRQNNKGIVALLLQRDGIDVDAKDSKGKTALDWAIEKERHGIVQLLRQHGARSKFNL